MVNGEELIGTTEYLTLQTRCRINRCRYNRGRLQFMMMGNFMCHATGEVPVSTYLTVSVETGMPNMKFCKNLTSMNSCIIRTIRKEKSNKMKQCIKICIIPYLYEA